MACHLCLIYCTTVGAATAPCGLGAHHQEHFTRRHVPTQSTWHIHTLMPTCSRSVTHPRNKRASTPRKGLLACCGLSHIQRQQARSPTSGNSVGRPNNAQPAHGTAQVPGTTSSTLTLTPSTPKPYPPEVHPAWYARIVILAARIATYRTNAPSGIGEMRMETRPHVAHALRLQLRSEKQPSVRREANSTQNFSKIARGSIAFGAEPLGRNSDWAVRRALALGCRRWPWVTRFNGVLGSLADH